jgi:hypothetical protein
VGTPELTKQHRHELVPAREPFRATLRLRGDDRFLKVRPGKQLEQLIEDAAKSTHSGWPPLIAWSAQLPRASYADGQPLF